MHLRNYIHLRFHSYKTFCLFTVRLWRTMTHANGGGKRKDPAFSSERRRTKELSEIMRLIMERLFLLSSITPFSIHHRYWHISFIQKSIMRTCHKTLSLTYLQSKGGLAKVSSSINLGGNARGVNMGSKEQGQGKMSQHSHSMSSLRKASISAPSHTVPLTAPPLGQNSNFYLAKTDFGWVPSQHILCQAPFFSLSFS